MAFVFAPNTFCSLWIQKAANVPGAPDGDAPDHTDVPVQQLAAWLPYNEDQREWFGGGLWFNGLIYRFYFNGSVELHSVFDDGNGPIQDFIVLPSAATGNTVYAVLGVNQIRDDTGAVILQYVIAAANHPFGFFS